MHNISIYTSTMEHMYITIVLISAPSGWAPKPPTSTAAPPRARPVRGRGTTWRPVTQGPKRLQLGKGRGVGDGCRTLGRWVWKCWEE